MFLAIDLRAGLVPPLQFSAQGETSSFWGGDVLVIGTKKSFKELEELIRKRLLKRLGQGMIEEVKKLRKLGLSWKRLDDFGLEYRYVAKYLQNKITRQEMIERLQKEIEHYAKRQMTWFSAHGSPRFGEAGGSASGGKQNSIHWIDNHRQAEKLVRKFLAG